MTILFAALALPTSSTNAKLRGHWRAAAAQTKREKTAATVALRLAAERAGVHLVRRVDARGHTHLTLVEAIPTDTLLTVQLTRWSPGLLDDDNLRGALKAVRDAVASFLWIDDASPRIEWQYAQAKTSIKTHKHRYMVEIRIMEREPKE